MSDDFATIENGLDRLELKINVRNKMGGALYWNIMNDECKVIVDKLVDMAIKENRYEEIEPLIQKLINSK